MRHLPTLPGCGQPATVRVEIYSPGPTGNAHGSLDAVVYACSQHAIEIVSALYVAGFTPHRDQDPTAARDMGRPCGHVFRYEHDVEPAGPTDHNGDGPAVAAYVAAMHVPEPATVLHPQWCQRTERTGAPHLSRPVHVRPDTEDGTRVALFIQQRHHTDDTAPQLVVQVDDGALTEFVVTLGHGKRLGREIGNLIALAGGGR